MNGKLKVTAKIGVFNSENEAGDFINSQLDNHNTFVSSDVRCIDGKYKATVVFCNPYDAAEYVFKHKSLEDIQTIAKMHKVPLTGDQLVRTTLSREDVERKIESGEIKSTFIKYNLDALFAKGATKYRKQVFNAHNIFNVTQKIKKTTLRKSRLISRLLMECSSFNYDDYAYEVAFLINK